MRVMIVGSGGREHALAWKLFASPDVECIICAPGNAGTALLGSNADVAVSDLDGLVKLAHKHKIDLTVVGPEAPLAAGIVNRFAEDGLRAFGPSTGAAQIEASKVWAKELLLRHGIPTGDSTVVEAIDPARAAIARTGYPAVIKADGLAGGKGVWVATDEAQAEEALDVLFRQRSLGDAGSRALVEQHLVGRELSVMAFTDGERLAVMPPARDHKRLGDGDTGPNTGGMGAFTRPVDATPSLLEQVEAEILRPTLAAMAREGRPFRGVLYAGLMLTRDGPKVLEFNCRFGDPEAQAILPLLESDLLQVCCSVAEGRLDPEAVRWGGGVTCGVVLAAPGYPHAPRLGDPIVGLEALEPGVLAFHGGTAVKTSGGFLRASTRDIVTAGGRVVTVVATGPNLGSARDLVYENVVKIDFEGRQFRSDIGVETTIALRAEPDEYDAQPLPSEAEPAPALAPDPSFVPTVVGTVALLAATAQEQALLRETQKVLQSLGVGCESAVVSAFHAPGTAEQIVREFGRRDVRAVVAVAGAEPALAGLAAAWLRLPVVAVPLPAEERATADSMVAAVQVPDGVPVSVVSPGVRGAKTAAWMAASILALGDAELWKRLRAMREVRPEVATL